MTWQVEVPDPELPIHRLRLLRVLIVCACIGLVARLWWVQIVRGDYYDHLSQGTRTRHVPLRAPRGMIFDCEGRVLATTNQQYMVVVDPRELRRLSAADRADVFGRAAAILRRADPQFTVESIQDTLDRSRTAGFSTIILKSGVGPAVITQLLESAGDLPGIDVVPVPVRSYPQGAVGAHVLGYLRDINADDLKRTDLRGYNGADQVGESGVERAYEQDLRGEDGEHVVEVNARGVPVSDRDVARRQPRTGDNLVLTIDSRLQRIAQEAFPSDKSAKPEDIVRGSVVAVDVRTGGILALASRPGFDPNIFLEDTPAARAARVEVLKSGAGPMQDRAISSKYPPASTFKMISATAGLLDGKLNLHDTVYCQAGLKLSRRGEFKKCWEYHGYVDFRKAMAQSCDAFFYDLMKRLSSTQLAAMARGFGLGKKTGIDLPGERMGFIPTPTWKARQPKLGRWFLGDSCNMAIGQGFMQVTPLQMAMVTAAVANGGKCLRPHVVGAVKTPQGQVVRRVPVTVNEVVNAPSALENVREGMRAAVVPGGTAGIVRFHDVAVAAKTGSAQAERNLPTHAWFVCFAPYEAPKIAICVMVEHGGHGGSTAGPVARALLKAYFHLKDSDEAASSRTD